MVYLESTSRVDKEITMSWYAIIYCLDSHEFVVVNCRDFLVYISLIKNICVIENLNGCRLWTCLDQACGMFGITTLTRECEL